MSQTLASVRGKVFCQPVPEKPFGPIRLCEPWQIPATCDGRSIGCDRRGPRRQRFLYDQGRSGSGVVLGSRDGRHGATSRFYRRVRRPLHRAATSQVRSKEVKSVWTDPAFAKRIGKQVPADGWVKKKSK